MRPPFEPMNMASLADMTRKLAFLLTLASAKRNSEVWVFSTDVRFGQDCSQCGPSGLLYTSSKLSFLPKVFGQKRWTRASQRPLCTCHDPLHPSMGEDLPVRFFCALSKRAQGYYLKLSIKGQHPNNRFRRLLCAFKWGTQVIYPSRRCQGGSDIWSHKAYSEGQDEDIPHLTHTNFQAREFRAFASSLAFHPTIP